MSDALLCSWDSTHDPVHGNYTTTNAAEVLPGVTKPLAADIWREWDYVWNYGVMEELGTTDLLAIPKPPVATTLPFIGGRFVINFGLNMAFTALYSVGEGSDFLKQFLEGGDALKSEAAADESRALATRATITEKWETSEERRDRNRERTRAAYRESRTRDWRAAGDGELLEALDAATELAGRIFIAHYFNSVGGGEYTTIVGNALDEHIPDHPPEWTNAITSGLTGVESALPAKAIWESEPLRRRAARARDRVRHADRRRVHRQPRGSAGRGLARLRRRVRGLHRGTRLPRAERNEPLLPHVGRGPELPPEQHPGRPERRARPRSARTRTAAGGRARGGRARNRVKAAGGRAG